MRDPRTALLSLAPLQTSCSCADFVRSSLALCEHGLVVLAQLEKEGASVNARVTSSKSHSLTWLPQHPLEGEADRLGVCAFA